MTFTVEDLIEPTGELDPAVLWPKSGKKYPLGYDEDAVAERLQGYLDEGYTKAVVVTDEPQQDEAARQWAYYRALNGLYTRLLASPSTVQVGDEGSSSYLLTQMEHIGELAAAAKTEFERILEEAAIVVDEVILPSAGSASVPVTFTF